MTTTHDKTDAKQTDNAQQGGQSQSSGVSQRTSVQLKGKSYEQQLTALSPNAGGFATQEAAVRPQDAAVQAKDGDLQKKDVHDIAAQGTQGSGGSLPYLDKIQSSFGSHDVSNVQAYSGGNAVAANESLGANAYASGNKVAFKGSTDLHTAAHEAAHIVQQRSGVSLSGGVGQAGDSYEQHADAVADAVVQGKSAEGLLNRFAGGSPGAAHGAATQLLEADPSCTYRADDNLANSEAGRQAPKPKPKAFWTAEKDPDKRRDHYIEKLGEYGLSLSETKPSLVSIRGLKPQAGAKPVEQKAQNRGGRHAAHEDTFILIIPDNATYTGEPNKESKSAVYAGSTTPYQAHTTEKMAPNVNNDTKGPAKKLGRDGQKNYLSDGKPAYARKSDGSIKKDGREKPIYDTKKGDKVRKEGSGKVVYRRGDVAWLRAGNDEVNKRYVLKPKDMGDGTEALSIGMADASETGWNATDAPEGSVPVHRDTSHNRKLSSDVEKPESEGRGRALGLTNERDEKRQVDPTMGDYGTDVYLHKDRAGGKFSIGCQTAPAGKVEDLRTVAKNYGGEIDYYLIEAEHLFEKLGILKDPAAPAPAPASTAG